MAHFYAAAALCPCAQPRQQQQPCLPPGGIPGWPIAYAEKGDDFSGCTLYSIVAWDHVSWPGNDFYAGSRATDDGVKAAATSSMSVLTGVEGRYDSTRGKYLPPQPYSTWGAVVDERTRGGRLRLWNPLAVWR